MAAAVRVEKATSDLLLGPDWTLNIDICDDVNSDHGFLPFPSLLSLSLSASFSVLDRFLCDRSSNSVFSTATTA